MKLETLESKLLSIETLIDDINTHDLKSEITIETNIASLYNDNMHDSIGYLRNIKSLTSTKINIKKLHKYHYELDLVGKYLDIVSLLLTLKDLFDVDVLEKFMKNDIKILSYWFDITTNLFVRDYYNFSLVFRYLSENNFGINITIIDNLLSKLNKNRLKHILSIAFKEVYGIKFDEVRKKDKKNSMSYDSLEQSTIDNVSEELRGKLL